MTKKRFIKDFECPNNFISFIYDNEDVLTTEEVVDLLNNLNDENELLKQFKEKVFDLIDKEIKETKEIFEDGKIDLITYNDSMIILTGLKEELKQ